MFKMLNNKLYFGTLNKDKSIIKVGITSQTCWARCKNADYRICRAIRFPNLEYYEVKALECLMINEYRKIKKIYKGEEYFYSGLTSLKDNIEEWYSIIEKVMNVFNLKEYDYQICGTKYVTPHSY